MFEFHVKHARNSFGGGGRVRRAVEVSRETLPTLVAVRFFTFHVKRKGIFLQGKTLVMQAIAMRAHSHVFHVKHGLEQLLWQRFLCFEEIFFVIPLQFVCWCDIIYGKSCILPFGGCFAIKTPLFAAK